MFKYNIRPHKNPKVQPKPADTRSPDIMPIKTTKGVGQDPPSSPPLRELRSD